MIFVIIKMIHSKQAPFAATLGIGCKKGKTMSKFDTGASQKTAFLTGASSGIGKAAALALIKEGYRVIGTSRSTKPDELRDGIRMIACDVTSDESVAAAVALAHAELGHIDLVVNNAGFGVTGAAEESSVARVHALFDTNFYGVVRMTNAALPIMRQQGHGRILNIGSIPGLVRPPTGLIIRPANLPSRVIPNRWTMRFANSECGSLSSSLGQRGQPLRPATLRATGPSPPMRKPRQITAWPFSRTMAAGEPAEVVAATIVYAARDRNPQLRYPAGKTARQNAFARRFLPRALFDKILHKQFGLS